MLYVIVALYLQVHGQDGIDSGITHNLHRSVTAEPSENSKDSTQSRKSSSDSIEHKTAS